MKSNILKNENSIVEISVIADEKTWKDAVKEKFNKAIENVEVDGFRKGHVPEAIAKKHVNMSAVLSEAAESLLNDMYVAAIKENDLWPVAQPIIDFEEVNENELKVKFSVAVKPEFEIGEYKGLSAEKDAIVVEDAEIEAQIQALLDQHVNLEVVDRAIENGDTAVIDFEGFKDGVAFEGGKAESYPLEIGSGSFIPGFEEQLLGKKAGDDVEVKVTFPEEYQVEDLAGKEAVFKVKIHEVKEKKANELNDEFVASLEIPEVNNVVELKEDISKNLAEQKQAQVDSKYLNDLLDQVSEKTVIEIPQPMIDGEVDAMYQQFIQRLAQQGMNEEMFLEMTKQSVEDIKKQMEEDAVSKIKYTLILEKIAELENIEVDEDEVNAKLAEIAAMYGMDVEQIKQMLPDTGGIEFEIKMQKATEALKNYAK